MHNLFLVSALFLVPAPAALEDRGLRIEDRGSRIEDRRSNVGEELVFRDRQSSILDPRSSILNPQSPVPVRVPFELLKSQHIAVQVKVNGKGPFRLVFDTGAPVTLINNKLAKEASVIPKDFRPPLFAPFGSMGQFKIKKFELGGLTAKNLPAVVMDHPTVELMSRALGRIDGIVGMSFFGRYRMTIDYQAKELTFVPSGFEPPDVMESMMKNFLNSAGDAKQKVVRPRGLLGLDIAKDKSDTRPGVNITRILVGSPAAQAGLKTGDRLLVLDDRWTDTVLDCYTAASHFQPGTPVGATILRDGKEVRVMLPVDAGL